MAILPAQVHPGRRVDLLQRPGPPRRYLLDDAVGNPRGRVLGDLRAVDLTQMRADLSRGQHLGR